MQINPTFAFVSGATQTDIDQFESAVNTVIAFYNSVFTNVGVTLNVVFAYGESYQSNSFSTTPNINDIIFQPIPNAGPGNFDLGLSQIPYGVIDYTALENQLVTKRDTLQSAAYATLPANSPFGTFSGSSFVLMTAAQEKGLGFFFPNDPFFPNVAGYDGVLGIISNEELAAGGYTADWTKSAPANGNQFYMIGAIEHELSEVMGRVAFDGTNFSYSMMDLFRYLSPGVRQLTNGDPAYFSIDSGKTPFYYWNNPALAPGDLGDWAPSGPNGAHPTGNDAFLNHMNPGVTNEVSAFDLDLMNVLGWNLQAGQSPTGPNPVPPAGTSADMILRHGADGIYGIWNIGSNAILGAYQLGQVGIDWQFAGLGGFNGSDTSDMLLRNSTTGGFELYDISNNNITNAAFIGTVGLNWQVAGFGNFSSNPGETDMIMRNTSTGGLEVYDISNNQITGAAFIGTVGLNWQVAGFGNFSGRPGETDMIMRNTTTGGLEVYDIANNQIIGATSMGAVG
jgi:hypothetical protein